MGIIIPSKPQYAGLQFNSAAAGLAWVTPAPGSAWNDGDILTTVTVGTIYNPSPNGSISAAAGPTIGVNMTLGTSASSGAPRQTYYGAASFTGAAAIESQLSAPFIINCPAGYVPTVAVTSTASPVNSTGFLVYLGTVPNLYIQQNHGGTNFGTYTAANPLTNSTGTGRAAAGASTGLVGIAGESSERFFAGYPGGSLSAGDRSLFGASQSYAPGWDNDGFATPVNRLGSGKFVLNLLQAYFPSMNGNLRVGIQVDTGNMFITGGTGFYIMDSTQTACATLIGREQQNLSGEQNGDVGARCVFAFDAAAVVGP